MTREELFSLADKVGLGFIRHASDKDIEKFEGLVKLVAFNEREACAKIAEEESMRGLPDEKPKGTHLKMAVTQITCGVFIADAIRARGQA
jgi:hypothetical protein